MEAKTRTFLTKVKAHGGEPVNERVDDLVDEGRALTKNGRTTRLVVLRHDLESMGKKHLEQNDSQYSEEGENDSQCSEKDL